MKAALFFLVIVMLPCGAAQQPSLTEAQKIERLIHSIEILSKAKFQRNGSYYSAQAAADHLRMKWKKAGSRIRTAKEFIDKIATASSMTGKPYTIRWSDGKEVATSQYLNDQLATLSAN